MCQRAGTLAARPRTKRRRASKSGAPLTQLCLLIFDKHPPKQTDWLFIFTYAHYIHTNTRSFADRPALWLRAICAILHFVIVTAKRVFLEVGPGGQACGCERDRLAFVTDE